jgi:transglutaminase-like putative cysteine protease
MAITVRAGYEISYDCPQPTPMILALSVNPSRRRDLITLDRLLVRPGVQPTEYCDGFGNTCHVIHAPAGPMDFSAWFEAYLGGRWYTFDSRHNVPRIGRILIARGRDATDVAIVTSFGPSTLTGFRVFTDEVQADNVVPSRIMMANS